MSKKGFTYTLQIDAEINDLIAKTAQVKKSMESVIAAGKAPGAEKLFGTIERAIDRLQQKAVQPIESVAAFSGIQKEATAVGVALGKLGNIVEGLGNLDLADKMDLLPSDLKKKIESASAALKTFEESTQKAALKSKDLTDAEIDLAAAKRELSRAEGKIAEKKQLITIQASAVKAAQNEADAIKAKKEALEKFLKTQAAYEAAGGDKRKAGGGKKELEGMNLPADRKAAATVMPGLDLKDAKAVQAAIAQLGTEYSQASKKVTDAEATQRRYTKSLGEWENRAQLTRGTISNLEGTVAQLNAEFEKNKAKDIQAAYTKLRTEAEKLGVDLTNIPIDYTEQNLLELNNAMNYLAADGIADIDAGLDTIQNEFEETGESAGELGVKLKGASAEVEGLDKRTADVSALKARIGQFLGLEGAINIAQHAMRNAFETVKSLDKAMTEMAVVTDLSVGDYWEQLPDYTERANALGVSIQGAYEAATLYYQQGLKSNEVTAMTNETLKMARIAGLSAEDATNKMTAALRGFNMELNETSAQRISDVYSELAAITASDVDEISSAMTKTASIAASAGMGFETTAAFLSQIIETTRESAETAGTAMKTVIARFQELKKDPAEIGEVDGEIVDANKIETALRSVGVALRDGSGQFRELDEVFLELSSKWADLDTNTQRYIATIAAGSRQQSRFIAMMSDYSRTQELVTAANTSAGASNKQFEKTMDSLQTKLTQLKNSWDTFTMSLMNNEVIKMGVDLLTGLMNTINGIVELFDKFGLGSAASIGMVVGALALGAKALDTFEMHLLAVNKDGQRVNTTVQALAKTGKQGFTALANSIKSIPARLKKIGTEAKTSSAQFKNFSSAQDAYTKALIKEQKIDSARYAAKQKITAEQAKSGALAKHYAATEGLASKATKDRVAAEMALYAALELTDEQKKLAEFWTNQGIKADTAAFLAKKGVTQAMISEYAATKGISEAKAAEELRTRLQNKSLYSQALARIAAVFNLKLEEKELKKLDEEKKQNILTTLAQTAVQQLYNFFVWLGVPPTIALTLAILALVAVVALVIVGIVALVKWFKNLGANSPEEQLKRAEEAAEAAGEAAKKAADAYNNLADSFESLADKYDALDELTHGTREWRDAVKEINEEVLALIDEYPELADLVKNEDGVLKIDIDSSEAQGLLDDYEKRSRKSSSAEIASKISVLRKQTVVDYDNLSDMWLKPLSLREEVNPFSISKALADGLLVENEGQWQITSGSEEALKKLGLEAEDAIAFANALGDGTEELKEFGSELNARLEQEKALYEAMALNAAQLVDTAGMSKEQQKMIDVANNANYIKTFADEAKDGVTEETKDMKSDSDEYSDWAKKEAAALYGVDEDEIKVNDEGKVTIGSGDDKKSITRSEFEKQVAASRGTEMVAKNLQNLPKAIASISGKLSKKGQGEAGEAFKKTYMAEEGKALTRDDIEKLKENKDGLKTLYEELGDEEKEAFGNYKNFEKHINDSIRLGEKAFDTATKTLDKMGVAIEMNERLTSEAAQGYADQLEYIMQGAGQAGVDKVNNALNSLAKTMTDEELSKFMEQLNAMDWKNMEDWEQLPERLEEIGLSLTGMELEEFINTAQDAAHAIRNIDLEALNEQMIALQSLNSKIKSGEQDRNISSSDYEALTAAIPELTGQFQQTLNGEFVYLGNSMLELVSAIEANTDALLGESTKQLQNKVEAAQLMEDLATQGFWTNDNSKIGDITEWKNWSAQGHTAKGYLKLFMDQAIQKEIDLSQLGIEGLSNDTINNLDSMDEEQINALMNSLVGVFNDLGKNSTSLLEKTVNSLSLVYQNRDATTNSMEVTQYRKILSKGGSLSEEEQVSMRASTNAIAAQANAAGVNIVDLNKYLSTLEKMNSLQEKLEKEEIDLSDFTQKYSSLTKEAERFEREVVNKTNLKKMNSQLATTTETLAGLSEEFNNLQDEASKIETTAKMVEDFGIQVDESNYETVAGLVETVAAGGEAGYSALKSLLTMSGKAYSLTLMDMAKMTEDTWNDSTNKMSTRMQLFADAMVKTGVAMWSELEDGSRKFVWASKNNLFDALTKIDDSSETETWENPYDEIYNLNKKINAVIRERERLERNYERALNDSSKTAQELADITAGELKALKEEAILQKNTAEVARQYISYRQKDNARFSKYYTYDSETNVIQVDWEAVGKSGWDSDTSDEFKEFISYLEEQVDIIQGAEDSLEDIQDSVDNIKNRGRDATSEIYDQVKEGLIKERQNQIDELQNINDSIQEAQSALVEQMQKQIDEARQARENDKTEEDIADKRTRLAYLQQDTSGAKALEIMALEKEIREAEEGYTDSLVDQALQKLQDANEKAAEQRQRQIDLAQLALNEYEESGKVWTDVKNLVDVGFDQVANGVPFVDTEAGKLALISQGINGLNPITKEDFYNELDRNAKDGAIHQGFISIMGGDEDGKEKKTIADLSNDVTNAIKTNMDFSKIEPPIVNVTVNTGDGGDPETELIKQQAALDAVGHEYLDRETYERDTSMSARLRRDYYGTYEEYVADVYDLVIKQGKTPEFKTGGLADFTGPAWLDGTKSRPELVLNQTDTANFIALKDILADIFDNPNSLSKGNSKSGGDNYYDIEISVEKIGDDYDVDRLADRIKEIIYEDSVYRNVNAVNFMR